MRKFFKWLFGEPVDSSDEEFKFWYWEKLIDPDLTIKDILGL